MCHTLAKFDVNIHLVRSGFSERLQKNLRFRTHQMHIEKKLRQRPNGLHNRWPERNILHEMAVHDVEMQPIRSRSISASGFFFQASEIGGEERRRDIHARGQYSLKSKV